MTTIDSKPDDASGPEDLSGRVLGNLHLLRRLGRGAMAEVYLAEQHPLSRRVAVKILRPEQAVDPTYLRRFEREAQAAASLVHANIVQIHAVGFTDGLHYIVQEYVQGMNLRQYIARHGPMDLRTALSIMRQVGSALAKAAEFGVIHRDIKPENILITPAGEVKVADFGLAQVAKQPEATDLTQAGITLGTPLYMSPEQVEGRVLTPRSDQYSFAATTYHMLTGSPPFTGETALGVAVQHLKREAVPLESLREDLPPSLCRIVHKMLAKNPDDRWESPQQLLGELRVVYLQHCQSADDAEQWDLTLIGPAADSRHQRLQRLDGLMKAAGRSGRRRRWAWASGLAASAALGVGAALWTAGSGSLGFSSGGRVAIPRESSALRQWYYAAQIGTPEAWQSVIDYFPENDYIARRVKQQQAKICLGQGDDARAMELFEALAASPDADKEFRAFGLAGKCGLLARQGKNRESAAVLNELGPLRGELRDPQLRKMLDSVIKENRAKLGAQSQSPWDWDRWLRDESKPGS